MKIEEKISAMNDIIEELKGSDIVTLKVFNKSVDMDAIIVATSRSIAHARGIANNVKIEAKRLGMQVVGIEGVQQGQWILVDLADIVVHIMTAQTRDYYKLEKLWSGAKDAE